MPGVMIIEALAQTAGILAFVTAGVIPDENTRFFFVGIDKARFRKPVEPGDQLVLTRDAGTRHEGHLEVLDRGARRWRRGLPRRDDGCAGSGVGREQGGRRGDGGCRLVIDPRAVISPKAELAADVTVGPFSIIGPDVIIGPGSVIGPHVVINGPTRMGSHNRVHQFASLGDAPQDKKYAGEPTRLEIGDRNVFRESCTLNRGTTHDKGVTTIGSDNLFMAYSHVAHDCVVGNNIVFANGATLGGHVRGGRLGHPRRAGRGPPVLQGRGVRVHRGRRHRHA